MVENSGGTSENFSSGGGLKFWGDLEILGGPRKLEDTMSYNTYKSNKDSILTQLGAEYCENSRHSHFHLKRLKVISSLRHFQNPLKTDFEKSK